MTDHIFYTSDAGIMRLNPFTGQIRRFGLMRADGISFSPDGTLWSLSWPDRGELIKWGRQGTNELVMSLSGGADGIAAGAAGTAFANRLVVNMNDGRVLLVDPEALTVTTIASGGSRGDFVKAGPRGGMYVTQSDQIVRFEGFRIAPQVVATTPAADDVLPQTITAATVTFNVDVSADDPTDKNSATNPANYLLVGTNSGPKAIASAQYDRPTRTVTLELAAELPSDRYVLLVNPRIASVAAKEMEAPHTTIFHVEVLPQVVATNPADGDLVSPGLNEILITFNRPMLVGAGTEDGSVLNVDNFHLLGHNNGPVAISSIQYDEATFVARLNTSVLLADFYTLRVETSLQSAEGINLPQAFLSQFTQLADVTGDFLVEYTGTRTNRTDGTEIVDLTVTNITERDFQDQLLLVMENLYPDSVGVASADGQTATGDPYVTLPGTFGGDQIFSPAEELAVGEVEFANSDLERIEFDNRLVAFPLVRNHLPTIDSEPITIATVDEQYRYEITATDADRDDLLFFLDEGLATMAIDHENGVLLWTPLPGTTNEIPVQIRVFEANSGNFVTQQFEVMVTDANQPPILSAIGNKRLRIGETLDLQIRGVDPEGAELSYFADNIPRDAVFDVNNGQFTWTPTNPGVFVDMLFAVTDGPRTDFEFVAVTVDGDEGTLSTLATATQLQLSAQLNAPAIVEEGTQISVAFVGQGSPAPGSSFRYSFDFDISDGNAFDVVNDPNPIATNTYKDNGSIRILGRIFDTATAGVFDATHDIEVENVPPTATVTHNGPGIEGFPVALMFSKEFDPSEIDTAAGFIYSYDWNGDSIFEISKTPVDTNLNGILDPHEIALAATDRHIFDTPGKKIVSAKISDKDGGETTIEHIEIDIMAPPFVVTTIAETGAQTGTTFEIGTLGDRPGINDFGVVSFTSGFAEPTPPGSSPSPSFSGIFATDATKLTDSSGSQIDYDPQKVLLSSAHLTRGETLSTRDFGRTASINNKGQVGGRQYVLPAQSTYELLPVPIPGPFGIPILTRQFITVPDPPQTTIRVWNPDGSQASTVAQVGGRRPGFDIFFGTAAILQGQPDFDFALNHTDLNDSGQVAYTLTHERSHRTPYELRVGTSEQDDAFRQRLPYGAFSRPQITNDGRVVLQGGAFSNAPILLNAGDSNSRIIADLESSLYSSGAPDTEKLHPFLALGRNPGVGADGKAVAFMGRESFVDPLTGAPRVIDGIYLSLPSGVLERKIWRILALNENLPFSSIHLNDRVAVSSTLGGSVLIAFIATTGSGRGLYTVEVNETESGNPVVGVISPVLSSSNISGFGDIADISFDEINDNAELAIHLSFSSGDRKIVRASQPGLTALSAIHTADSEVTVEYRVSGATSSNPLPAYRIGVYLSADDVFDPQIDQLIGTREFTLTNRTSGLYSTTVSTNATDADVNLFVWMDDLDAVPEFNEDNNVVAVGRVDLLVSDVTDLIAQSSFDVTYQVKDANSPNFEIGLFYSDDDIWDVTDQRVPGVSNNVVMSEADKTVGLHMRTLNVAPNIVAGSHNFVLVVIDSMDAIPELDEINNVYVVALRDLVVTAMHDGDPDDAVFGRYVSHVSLVNTFTVRPSDANDTIQSLTIDVTPQGGGTTHTVIGTPSPTNPDQWQFQLDVGMLHNSLGVQPSNSYDLLVKATKNNGTSQEQYAIETIATIPTWLKTGMQPTDIGITWDEIGKIYRIFVPGKQPLIIPLFTLPSVVPAFGGGDTGVAMGHYLAADFGLDGKAAKSTIGPYFQFRLFGHPVATVDIPLPAISTTGATTLKKLPALFSENSRQARTTYLARINQELAKGATGNIPSTSPLLPGVTGGLDVSNPEIILNVQPFTIDSDLERGNGSIDVSAKLTIGASISLARLFAIPGVPALFRFSGGLGVDVAAEFIAGLDITPTDIDFQPELQISPEFKGNVALSVFPLGIPVGGKASLGFSVSPTPIVIVGDQPDAIEFPLDVTGSISIADPLGIIDIQLASRKLVHCDDLFSLSSTCDFWPPITASSSSFPQPHNEATVSVGPVNGKLVLGDRPIPNRGAPDIYDFRLGADADASHTLSAVTSHDTGIQLALLDQLGGLVTESSSVEGGVVMTLGDLPAGRYTLLVFGDRDSSTPEEGSYHIEFDAPRFTGGNLIAEILAHPTEAIVGSDVETKIHVENIGTEPTSSTFATLFVAKGPLVGEEHVSSSKTIEIPPLAPGSTAGLDVVLPLPGGLLGESHLGVIVDTQDLVTETSKKDNSWFEPLIVGLAPDFWEPNDSGSQATKLGSAVQETSIQNANIASLTDEDWFELYLPQAGTSADSLIITPTSGAGLAELSLFDEVGNLVKVLRAELSDSVLSASLEGLPAGRYSASIEVTNALPVTYDLTLASADRHGIDFVVRDVLAPLELRSGKTIGASATLENQGDTDSGEFRVQLVLSRDNILDGSDVLIGDAVSIAGIGAGASVNIELVAETPLGLDPDAKYYIGVIADPGNAIIELNDELNSLFIPVRSTRESDDTESSLGRTRLGAVEGSRVLSGLNLDFPSDEDWFEFRTTGTGTADDFVRLTFDKDAGDIALQLLNEQFETIAMSTAITAGREISLSGRPGKKYLLRIASAEDSINPDYSLEIHAPFATGANLIVEDVRVPFDVRAGQTLEVEVDIANIGNADAGPIAGQFVISGDAAFDLEDQSVGPIVDLDGQTSGNSQTLNLTITLPDDLDSGQWYYLGFLLDPFDVVAESSEADNVSHADVLILPEPDVYESASSSLIQTVQRNAAQLGTLQVAEQPTNPIRLFSDKEQRASIEGLSIDSGDDVDWFVVDLLDIGRRDSRIDVHFSANEGNLSLFLYDEKFKLLKSSEGFGDSESVNLNRFPAGSYYALVKPHTKFDVSSGYSIHAISLGEDVTDPTVDMSSPIPNSQTNADPLRILLKFSEPMGESASASVTDPSSYRVIYAGPNEVFQNGLVDDERIAIDHVRYDRIALTATLEISELLADGNYRVEPLSVLQDLSGNSLAAGIGFEFTLDRTRPTVVAIAPAAGAALDSDTNQLVLAFSEEMTQGESLASVDNIEAYALIARGTDGVFGGIPGDDREIVIDSLSYDSATRTVTLNLSEDELPLPQDFYRLGVRAWVEDLAGNRLRGLATSTDANDFVLDFFGDSTHPNVSIDVIGNGGVTANSSPLIQGQVSDNHGLNETLTYTLDDTDPAFLTAQLDASTANGQFMIQLPELADGEHSLMLTVADQASLTTTETVLFILDTSSPVLHTSVGRDGFIATTTVSIEGLITDTIGLGTSLSYIIDGGPKKDTVLSFNTLGTEGSFAFEEVLASGPHEIDLEFSDLAGNVTTSRLEVVVDLIAPSIQLDPIGNNGYIRFDPISGSILDETQIYSSLQYAFDGDSLAEMTLSLNDDNSHGGFAIPTTGLVDGEHTIRIIAQDQAGNTVDSSVTFVVDTLGPMPVELTPQGTNLGSHRVLTVVLGEDVIDAENVASSSNLMLEAAGGDHEFGNANDFAIPIFDEQLAYDENFRIVAISLPASLTEDFYRLIIKGSGPNVIRDLAGNPFNDGVNFVHEFVILDPPAVAREPERAIEAGDQPLDVVLIDLDGNGLDDLVTVDRVSGALTVAVNDGSAQWQSVEAIDLGLGPLFGIATGHFNNDNRPDLLLQSANGVSVAVGDDLGGFALQHTVLPAGLMGPPGGRRIGLLATDVNNDSLLDAVLLSPTTDEVIVLLGDGTGQLAVSNRIATGGTGPIDLAAGNFLGDDNHDLAVAHYGSESVTFLTGDGLGNFVVDDEFTITSLGPVSSIEAADFNRDGRTDLAIAAANNSLVALNTEFAIEIVPLENGDFDNGLDGWTLATSQSVADAGRVEVISGAAVFQEGAAGRVTLQQQLTIPARATQLSFDLLDNGLEPTSAGRLPDAFEVALLDAAGKSLLGSIGPSWTAPGS